MSLRVWCSIIVNSLIICFHNKKIELRLHAKQIQFRCQLKFFSNKIMNQNNFVRFANNRLDNIFVNDLLFSSWYKRHVKAIWLNKVCAWKNTFIFHHSSDLSLGHASSLLLKFFKAKLLSFKNFTLVSLFSTFFF
jgi:hypothetical protein